MKVLIVNGPNLNALGQREVNIYGSETLEDLEKQWVAYGNNCGVEIEVFQSNIEGEIIDYLYKTKNSVDGIIMNPGALTHYSYALRDCISAIEKDVLEVHLSNVDNREEFRKISVITPVACGKISGLGKEGYILAINFFILKNEEK
ncbi:MAG: 3-dehydroquinate dehydratase II [Fusobacteria bacterium]|nr:MAG: 3-dehydroquinate dehydratase II [Fusobacteriota bacterium]KAF0230005.1 MAG: 3-dehydroquinate dehydratase [Fusobacteriota bacterium]